MGKDNRRRRAAKQRRRDGDRRQRAPHNDTDLAAVLWSAVDVIADATAEEAADAIALLETMPAELDAVIDGAATQLTAAARRHGWSDDDLIELRARRLKAPSDASARERNVRWLALLATIPPLPPVATRRAVTGDDAMLAKIRALLAKAESTTFPAEAEALTAKAQELMARHRIEAVLLDGDDDDGPVGRRIWLDDPYADAKSQLLSQVALANGCRSVTLTGLACAHVTGYASDLDVVELLHTSLLVQATTAIAAAGPQRDSCGRSRTRSFRHTFLVAYAWRIGERLRASTASVTDEVAATRSTLLPALRRRDAHVEDAVAKAFPHTVTRRISTSNANGWRAGTIAADGADLSVGQRLAGTTARNASSDAP